LSQHDEAGTEHGRPDLEPHQAIDQSTKPAAPTGRADAAPR
jgi:hypothetical protein